MRLILKTNQKHCQKPNKIPTPIRNQRSGSGYVGYFKWPSKRV